MVLLRTVVLALILPALNVSGAVLRHSLEATDSMFSVQSQKACSTYLEQPYPHWCNPALFPFGRETGIRLDLALNVDQRAYDTTDSLVNKPITKEFLEKLFKEHDFQAFSGIARIETVTPYFSLAYTPVHLVGAYQLSNPNLPELVASGLRNSEVRLTSGKVLFEGDVFSFYSGASLGLFNRKFYKIDASVLDLVVKKVDQLSEVKKSAGLTGDLGVFVLPKNEAWPSFSLNAHDLFTPQEERIGQETAIDLEPQFRRKMRLGMGKTISKFYGSFHLGLELTFWDFFVDLDRFASSVSMIYGIGRLRAFLSGSPLMSAFGFLFMGMHYQIGLQYTNDKQDNSIELNRRRNVYLFMSFAF